MQPNQRDMEAGIQTDFTNRLSYGGYLQLDQLLSCQHPLSNPPQHDEMLFIVQHQVSELWLKQLIHELRAAIGHVQRDELAPCFKILSRAKLIQQQLFNMWAVLETMTPSEYAEFRPVLGQSSGFQSFQYRTLEYLLGNKHAGQAEVFRYDAALYAQITADLNAPSIWDEFLRLLARRGFAIPADRVERDFAQPYAASEGVVAVFKTIYQNPKAHWESYEMAEKLVDVEEAFQLWRFRHMKTVERIIGFKQGTGGSSGVAFLKRALDLTFFPELIQVRSVLA
jgi:tryptophan 2,3-dioxygenase